MKGINHIYFDLDHTLWDFEKNSRETLAELYETFDLANHIESADDFIRVYQFINSKYWSLYREGKIEKALLRTIRFEKTFNYFKMKEVEDLSRSIGEKYLEICPLKPHLFPGAIDVLSHLKERANLHIITNGFLEVQHIKMKSSGITDYFDLVLCSEEVGVNKPHPKIFNFALESRDASADESLMIGDTHHVDIIGARNVGMQAIYFNPKKELVDGESQQIHDLSELIDIFE